MNTPIHISKKLEKLISKHIGKRTSESNFYLGKWNANIFYVDRKKCWLFTNSETKFSIIIPNLKSADIKNITEIFTENLYSQLIYESILIDFEQLKDWIWKVFYRNVFLGFFNENNIRDKQVSIRLSQNIV
jgi:uncharacterized protein DUF6933